MRAKEHEAMAEQLFVGGGEMGALLRSHDWSQTQLGAVETWSDDLRAAVQILLTELEQAKRFEKQPLNSDLPSEDIAAIVLHETVQADEFRVKLTEALRPLTDAIEIQAIAAHILGESLGANRVIYLEVTPNSEEVIVHRNYTNGVAQLSGRYRLEDYRRNLSEDHQSGQTQIVTNIPNNPRYTDAEKAKYRETGIAAHIDVPLIKNNQFVALLAVHQSTPRQWTEAEVKRVEETAERTWAAVERARAEAALRESEAILNTINQATPTLIYMKDRQGRLRMANPAVIRAIGKPESEIIGCTDVEFHLDRNEAEAIMANDRQVMETGQIQMFEEVAELPEGRRTFLSTKSPYLDETGTVIGLIGVSFDITNRKQAEAELQASEAKLRLFIEQAPVSVAIFDRQMCYLTVSQRWVDEYHLESIETVIGRSHYDLFPNLPDRWRQAHQRCLAGASEKHEEDWFILPDGSEQWLRWEINPWYDSAGIVGGILLFAENITQRKQAEIALQESEQRLKLALKTGKLGSWQLDLKTNELFTSEQCKINYGFLPDADFSHQMLFNRIHPDDLAWVEAAIQQTIAQHSEYDVEYRTVWDDGTVHWALVRGTVVYDTDGTPLRMVGMSLDITHRKQAEVELYESEARYRLLAEAIPQFVWITDAQGQNQYVNRRFCDYTGLTTEQMHGLNWLSIIHPDDLEMTRDRWLAAVNSGQFYEIEYRFRGMDGSYRWFLGQGIPLKDEQGCIHQWFGTCTDIEPQKQVEQARLRLLEQEQIAREQAETANRIKDEFLAVLSHELRSPLNPILGWARLLQNCKLDEAQRAEALKTIERNAKLQLQLIEDLLDISRVMQGKLSLITTPVSLGFVITAAVETVRLAAEAKGISIQFDLDNGVAPIFGDAARLQQVVWNLLTNAVKFTPNGGQVTVELKQISELAQIRVIDTGKGINPQFLPHVFEYFRQEDGSTTRKFGGLGLGLAIVRQIVEMHGGTVKAESQGENQGATFVVRLPLMGNKEWGVGNREQSGNPLLSTPDSSLTGLHILLVDDEIDTREFQAFVLEQSGARVTVVASGLEALQALDQFTPDVLISDVGMAEMDGYMLIQQIRSREALRDDSRSANRGGKIPAIALTAYAADIDQQKALQAGFQAHLTKPIEPEVLVRAIASLVLHN